MGSGPRRLGSVREPGGPRTGGVASLEGTFCLLRKLGQMNVVQGTLVAVAVAAFIYLGIALFKPEWF
jgi:hypothetical protein